MGMSLTALCATCALTRTLSQSLLALLLLLTAVTVHSLKPQALQQVPAAAALQSIHP